MQKSRARKGKFLSMSFISVGLAFCGFAVVLWLLYQNDYRAVLRTVADVGAGVAVVVLVRGVILAACGLAWWCLLRGLAAVRVRVVLGLRTVGEAVNVLLPVAAVGGDVVRARLLNLSGVAGGVAAASTLVDLLLQAAAQALFALIGVALLMQIADGTEVVSWAARGLGIAALALGGFYGVQRFGGARIVERGLRTLARRWPATIPGSAIRLHDSLQAIYAGRPAIAAAFSLHELAWLFGAFETWIALWLMGVRASAPEALILESLTQALRAAAFPMPSGLGIQEGGFIALGTLFGIPPEAALALSFVKRVPDLAIGLPSLLAWYWLEMQQLLPITAAVPPPGPHGQQAALWTNGPLTNGSAFTPQADDQNG
jgi:glycosyltransferase 2 family protein